MRSTGDLCRATAAFALTCMALSVLPVSAQTTYSWQGGTSSDFATSANWQGGNIAVVGGTYNERRISVLNGTGSPLIYTAIQGDTVYVNTGDRSLFIASGNHGAMSITGGSFESRTTTQDGLSNGSNGTLTIDGGTYIKTGGANPVFIVKFGGAGTGTLTIDSGSFSAGELQFWNASGGAGGVVNLNGGTLSTAKFYQQGTATSTVNFNGGTLEARVSSTVYMRGLDAANILGGGAVIDTAGYDITIGQALLDGGGGGGLTKSGSGKLTLTNANTFTGAVVVNGGQVRITDPAGLGTTAGDTTVNGDGPRVELLGGITISGETINISGRGGNLGALQSSSGDNTWNGPINITSANARVGALDGAVLRLAGTIDDGASSYPFNVRNGNTGVVILSGTTTQGGTANVIVGTLRLDGGNDRLAVNHSLVLGNGSNVDSATFDLNGYSQQLVGLGHQGTTMPLLVTDTAGGGTLTVNNTSTFTYRGDVVGPLTIAKTAGGTFTLNGDLERTDLAAGGGTLNGSATWHCLVNGAVAEDQMSVTGGTLDIRSMTLDFDIGAGATADDYVVVDYAAGGTLQANATTPFFGSVADLPAGYQLIHNEVGKQIILASDEAVGNVGTVIRVK